MRTIKLYDWNTILDFGKFKGQTVRQSYDKEPEYINWCLQKLTYVCITDDVFCHIPTVVFLVNNKSDENKRALKFLTDIHESKKIELGIKSSD